MRPLFRLLSASLALFPFLSGGLHAEESLSEKLEHYLAAEFPASISQVSLSPELIHVSGQLAAEEGVSYFLADIPMDVIFGSPDELAHLVPLEIGDGGQFRAELPRLRERNERSYDRLTSRWRVVEQREGGATRLISAARYVENIDAPEETPPAGIIRHKKGLGGWHTGHLPNELNELGISAVTVNVVLHTFLSLEAGEGREPFEWQGRTYYVNMGELEKYDRTFLTAAENKVVVSAILLVPNHARHDGDLVKLLGHPDATKEGIYAMPNVTSEEGISLYGAILKLMTERWCRADEKYGRVHHWIVHNEVDAGFEWTNAGHKSAVEYMDLYLRSMRLVDLMARQIDPNSRAFVTLTHHWAHPGLAEWYGSRQVIDLLAKFSAVEGDFPWAVAFHPYPQNLFDPRTWQDDQAQASVDSPKVTPRNLEVLDAYMQRPELLHRGKIRPVHLSENGFNSKEYDEVELENQAAGMAFAWKKIAPLKSIEVWHYHNWVDHRGEGGLRIGLRKFPDDEQDPLGPKPIWHLYHALNTDQEDEVTDQYLPTIGIESWDILHKN